VFIPTSITLAVFLPVVFPDLWDYDRTFVFAWYGLFAVITPIGIVYGVRNIRSPGTFQCRLSKERLECNVPVPGCGDSFSIAVQEISKIEKVAPLGDGGPRWYVWDHSGRRYALTVNYGNPVERIVALIQELNPAVEEIQT
jgi:hypothetical protein